MRSPFGLLLIKRSFFSVASSATVQKALLFFVGAALQRNLISSRCMRARNRKIVRDGFVSKKQNLGTK